eukprot:8490946-Pyramimonas_sp.AAC.1
MVDVLMMNYEWGLMGAFSQRGAACSIWNAMSFTWSGPYMASIAGPALGLVRVRMPRLSLWWPSQGVSVVWHHAWPRWSELLSLRVNDGVSHVDACRRGVG